MFSKFDASVSCPECGKPIHPRAVACRHCNAAVVQSASVPTAQSPREGASGALAINLFALVVALGSWLFVTQATVGVAGLAFACLLGIFARIVQAQYQHRLLMQHLARSVQP